MGLRLHSSPSADAAATDMRRCLRSASWNSSADIGQWQQQILNIRGRRRAMSQSTSNRHTAYAQIAIVVTRLLLN